MAETILSAQSLHRDLGVRVLFTDINFSIAKGDKVALLGSNGCGKSTLLKIIAGLETDYRGEIIARKGMRTAYLAQEVDLQEGESVSGYIFSTLGLDQAKVLEEYHQALQNGSEKIIELDEKIESMHLRAIYSEFKALQGKLEIEELETFSQELSGGQQKRIQLARALLGNPDLLILDEPTNHLDAESIVWLENWLDKYNGTVILVTHDRWFLENAVNRIFEMWNGGIYFYDGSWSYYLEKKAELVNSLQKQEASRQNFLRREVEWVRRSPCARGTKSKSRLQRFEDAANQKIFQEDQRSVVSLAKAERLGKRVVDAHGLKAQWDDQVLFADLDLQLFRGGRIGLLGPNGCGKSTLLKMLLGEIPVQAGEIKVGESVQFAVYRQKREDLNPNLTVWDTVKGDSEYVTLNGQQVHKRGFLQAMLFSPDQQKSLVGNLSGGEKNRLQIAQVMLQPSNVLVLDEPTNDLDVYTLEKLEAELEAYTGCLLVVSHDRYFLEKVCHSLLVFHPEHGVHHLPGTYSYYEQWLAQKNAALRRSKEAEREAQRRREQAQPKTDAPKVKKKISYHEKRELDAMEETVLTKEAELEELQAAMSESSASGNFSELQKQSSQLENLEKEIATLYDRWQELEELG